MLQSRHPENQIKNFKHGFIRFSRNNTGRVSGVLYRPCVRRHRIFNCDATDGTICRLLKRLKGNHALFSAGVKAMPMPVSAFSGRRSEPIRS
jgi:hypothetical protein